MTMCTPVQRVHEHAWRIINMVVPKHHICPPARTRISRVDPQENIIQPIAIDVTNPTHGIAKTIVAPLKLCLRNLIRDV